MNRPPEGWPRISSAVFYDDPAKAIDWLCAAFGDGLIMVGSTGGKSERPVPLPCKSPRALGGANTQSLCICVDDLDAHCEKARGAGAKIMEEPATQDYGEEYLSDRTYRAEDPEGHQWWFMQRIRDQRR